MNEIFVANMQFAAYSRQLGGTNIHKNQFVRDCGLKARTALVTFPVLWGFLYR